MVLVNLVVEVVLVPIYKSSPLSASPGSYPIVIGAGGAGGYGVQVMVMDKMEEILLDLV